MNQRVIQMFLVHLLYINPWAHFYVLLALPTRFENVYRIWDLNIWQIVVNFIFFSKQRKDKIKFVLYNNMIINGLQKFHIFVWILCCIGNYFLFILYSNSSRNYLGQCSTKCKHFPGYCHVQVILVYSKLLKFGVLVNKHGYYIYQEVYLNVHLPIPYLQTPPPQLKNRWIPHLQK